MHPHTAHLPLMTRVRAFAHAHDDVPAFHAAFLVWTFLAAAIFNIGFFALVIAAHMSLDVVKYRDVLGYNWSKTLKAVFLESFVDITLLFVALASAVYLHHSLALSILSGLSRAELTIVRALALLFTKMQIIEHVLHVLVHVHSYLHVPHPLLTKKMTRAQKLCAFALMLSIALLIASPVVFSNAHDELGILLMKELIPWKI